MLLKVSFIFSEIFKQSQFSLKFAFRKTNELHTNDVQLVKKRKKKRNTLIHFNTNYRTEMKLIPIIMDISDQGAQFYVSDLTDK